MALDPIRSLSQRRGPRLSSGALIQIFPAFLPITLSQECCSDRIVLILMTTCHQKTWMYISSWVSVVRKLQATHASRPIMGFVMDQKK